MPRSGQGFNLDCTIPQLRCADSRFAKPRNSSKERFYVLFASTKRTKSSRRAAALSTPGERFKTLQNNIFRVASVFRPYAGIWCDPLFRMFWTGAKGLQSCRRKTVNFRKWDVVVQAHRGKCIQKGQLHVIFVAVGICFCGMRIEISRYPKVFAFF